MGPSNIHHFSTADGSGFPPKNRCRFAFERCTHVGRNMSLWLYNIWCKLWFPGPATDHGPVVRTEALRRSHFGVWRACSWKA
eukprot:NODE_1413_length_881_cov_46.954327_g1168_i0.p3 GENE.NODE_1413_length_881_cov_46.954327_g1168_i0~~NODE_1413_length_881_cov_46.954327_g1168_i0.p3  ORF type:complete len:92 (-),score=7.47 NODE_1413_length_881_cov_46.954327_g1168_i0:605-850(-)